MNWFQRGAVRVIKGLYDAAGLDSQAFFQALFGNTMQGPRKGSKELLDAFETMPWLRAVNGRISGQVGGTVWCLYVATTKPSGDEYRGYPRKAIRMRKIQRCHDPALRRRMLKDLQTQDSLREITDHPALDLLEHGNSEFDGNTALSLTQTHLDLIGESLWVFDRNGLPLSNGQGVPTDLWPIPATWITRLPTKDQPYYLISTPRGAKEVPESDTIWFRHPRPADPYLRGAGIGHALGDELETDEYAAKHLKGWFRNFARPDIFVTAEGLSRPEVDKIEDQWLKKLTMRTNKPFFLNRKVDIKEISHTFQEMQMSDLRKDERDILIHVYGCPPEIFGILENSNRSTIDAADYLMAKYVVMERQEFIRRVLQIRLIERYDPRLILDYVSPIKEDTEFELKVRQAHPTAWTEDEWRALGGSPELPNNQGKIHIVPFNVTAVEELSELLDAEPPAPTVPPTPDDTIDTEDEDEPPPPTPEEEEEPVA